MLRIQRIAPVHIPGFHLARLANRDGAETPTGASVLASRTAMVLATIDAGLLHYVAVSANCVVGWAGLLPIDTGEWRLDMGVVPFYRRKGIASALLTEMLAADERGYGAVTLELPADDGQASRLLEGHRFASHWGEVSGTVVWRRNVSDRNRDINTKPSASTEVVHLETHHER